MRFILLHVPFTFKSNSKNRIEICQFFDEVTDKNKLVFLWPTV